MFAYSNYMANLESQIELEKFGQSSKHEFTRDAEDRFCNSDTGTLEPM